METPDLLMVCVSAFFAVFVLLAFLAVVMRALITVFPQIMAKADPAVLAAVSTAAATFFPGTKITRVEEER